MTTMPEHPAKSIDTDAKLYSSRLLKLYLEYLHAYYPDVDRTALLENAGVQRFEIDDPDYWFSLRQLDRFHAALNAVVTHPNIMELSNFSAILREPVGASPSANNQTRRRNHEYRNLV